MKKIIALSLVAGALAANTAFSQGYLVIQSSRSAVNDVFTTPGTPQYDSKVDVALFISANGSATPTVEGLVNGTPTTGTASFSIATAWTDIQNDPNFSQAVDATATPGNPVIMLSSSKGVAQYNGGFAFGLNGTTTTGSYSLFEVSWNAQYATIAAAAAAGSAVGWSPVLNSITLLTASAPSPETPVFANFGTQIAAVPEPGTMALAGLGGLSLLAFRRKK